MKPGSTRWQVIIVSSLLFAVCNSIQAQQSAKIPRIGVLVTAPAANATPRIQALQQGLHELGYYEGKSIFIEYRYAEGKQETLLERIDELIRLNLELIITDTSNAINTAKNATKTIPIVFTVAIDPVGDGQVSSIARPGGNLTGLSILAPELNGKRLELLRETLPKLSQVAFFTRIGPIGKERFSDAEAAAKALGLQLHFLGAKGADDLQDAFDAAKRIGIQALMTNPSTFLVTNRVRIIELAAKYKLPTIYPGTEYAEAGGLVSYGPNLNENWRRAATYVDKILKGAQPGELPIEQPRKFELLINLKTAKQIGLIVPPNVLARADRVIK